MKLKTNILFSLLLCGTFATAQNLKLDILPPSVTLGQDSATVFMKMTLNVPQMDTKSHIRLTPVLTDGTHTAAERKYKAKISPFRTQHPI